jgi:predicted SAM-dependent methyltransferase
MTNKLLSNSVPDFAGINLACGGKLCQEPGWINGDHSPSTKDVIKINLLRSFPFADNTFDVVYHSQFIEHLPHEKALAFMGECYRILKPNGVLRVVTPDLHNQAVEYLRNLQAVLNTPNDEGAKLRYDWIRLEMLDQLTRHTSGGDMVTFLNQSGRNIRDYLCQRMGRSGENLIPNPKDVKGVKSIKDIMKVLKKLVIISLNKITPERLRVGRFRLSGESHLCMYDEYLLSTLLAKAGFANIAKVSAKESSIPNWDMTQLDCDEQGNPDGQVSLFMEAAKPANK